MKRRLLSLILVLGCILACSAVASASDLSELAAVPSIPDNVIYVADVDSFLMALDSDKEIYLAAGEYNLTQASSYGRTGGRNYHWESVYDGYELVITDTSGIVIRGETKDSVTICTEPRYANVIRVENCSNLILSDLTLGHTKEQGSCTGGVLQLAECSAVEIISVGLYGCGIRGIDMTKCSNVHVDITDIYDCSEGCVYMEDCENVLFENSKFYRCYLWNGLFECYTSRNVAFINSEIYENQSLYTPDSVALLSSTSQGVYLGGLDVHENGFHTMFASYYPCTVEKCRFQESPAYWYSAAAPVDGAGTALNSGDFVSMKMRTVSWTPAEIPEVQPPQPSEDGKIHVSTVDEFLAAIGHNVTIYLEPGEYNLTQAWNYMSVGGEFYSWDNCYDGAQLVIEGVHDLVIEGSSAQEVSILAESRYANVLNFRNSSGIILRNFTAGHTIAPGECSGGVLDFLYVNNVNIESCSLFGCGILGIWALDCNNLYAVNTEIYECSTGGAWFFSCSNVSLDACSFHDNGGPDCYADHRCSNVTANGAPVVDQLDS